MFDAKEKQQVITLCESAIQIARTSDDVVFGICDDKIFSQTLCEKICDSLLILGVEEPHVDEFFELDITDDRQCKEWISLCIENPEPDA